MTKVYASIQKWNFPLHGGKESKANGEFDKSYVLDVVEGGNVWVANRGNSRVQNFDNGGNFILTFGSEGRFRGDEHVGLHDFLEYVYAVDSENHRIQKFDTSCNNVDSIG